MKLAKVVTLLLFASIQSFAWQIDVPDNMRPGRQQAMPKIAGSPRYSLLNINTLSTWSASNGVSNHSPRGDNGTFFPRETSGVIYQDGLVWVAKAYLDAAETKPANPSLRVNGAWYVGRLGTQEGWITGYASGARPVDISDARARIYRIRRDYVQLTEQELREDAAEYFELWGAQASDVQIDFIRAQYEFDWNNWPVDLGAPYIERNGIPGYQQPPRFNGVDFTADSLVRGRYDEPGVAGADNTQPVDQVLWMVYNDLANAPYFAGSPPLGLEIQKTAWAYKRSDAFGYMYFTKHKLINKGGVDVGGGVRDALYLDSLFIGQWSDPEVGVGTDDLAGCDTLLKLGFAFTAYKSDQAFEKFGLPPPAVGYIYLQGPMVASSGDSAVFELKRRYGFRNLPLRSFGYDGAGDMFRLEPYPLSWWNALRGFRSYQPAEIPYRNHLNEITLFPLSGDPVTREGDLDGLGTANSLPPGSRSTILLTSGPITLAPGDTQEVLIAGVVGLGADNLSSVTVMKSNARFARLAFKHLFSLPHAPAAPVVRTVELDGQIVLYWGSDIESVKETEKPIFDGEYEFEGYNIYEFPSTNADLSKGIKIATFDVQNGVLRIVEDRFDPSVGRFVQVLVQSGEDTGIQRFTSIKQSMLKGLLNGEPLRNGREYYFAVTAYNYAQGEKSPGKSYESAPAILTLKPRIPFGIESPVTYGDILKVSHISGSSNGTISPYVIDPLSGTGDSYQVRFDTTGGQLTWFVTNTTKNRLVISGQANQTGDEDYPILEGGVLLKVIDGPSGSQPNTVNDVFSYTSSAAKTGPDVIKASASHVGVYPNPYYGAQSQEVTTWRHFVTFNNLPPKVKIQIYNIGGQLVRTLEKNDPSQFLEWDLTNQYNWQVASGIYICYVEMPDIGETKVLKLAVIQQQLMLTH